MRVSQGALAAGLLRAAQELWALPATRLASRDDGSIVAASEERVIAGACLCCTRAAFQLREPGASPRLALHDVAIVVTHTAY